LVYRGTTRGALRDRNTGAESVGYIGRTTGGTLRDTGGESVGYIGGTTGGTFRTLKDTGAESVRYIGGMAVFVSVISVCLFGEEVGDMSGG